MRLLALLLALLLAAPASAQLGSAKPNIRAELVADGLVRPGAEIDLAISMSPAQGWHGYWSNPGDAGQPMSVDWKLPRGASVTALRYPVPQTLTVAGLQNYIFKGPYALLARLRIPADAKGTIPLRAEARWLACTDKVCVPERGTLQLDLVVGATLDNRARFDDWRRKLPQPLGAPAIFAQDGNRLRLALPLPASVRVTDPHFFPDEATPLDHAAPQRFFRDGDRLIAQLETKSPAATVSGVVSFGGGRGLVVDARAGSVQNTGIAVGSGGEWGEKGVVFTLLWALAGALAGGLLLNLMPCVFPILALKALALARAGGDERHARRDALSYTAGAVVGTASLGIALLLIRAGGTAAGWAFQLQDPRTILVLLLLATAITLNLLGIFKLPVLGGEASPRSGFATGALAAFVATPCAGPFMGAALGAALLLPPAAAILIFAALGLGIALPFLAVAFIPALRRKLPKPGQWMATLQRILAIPMAISAAACLWLLWRSGGNGALAIGIAALLITLILLAFYGRRQAAGNGGGWAVAGVLLLASGAAAALLPAPSTAARTVAGAEPWSEARVAELRAQKRPALIYFTADWCLTCKVNEANAIDRTEVRKAFADSQVAVLAGDWTNGDPAITRFLESRGRAGVPLTLWLPRGGGEFEELPQLLTPAMLTERSRR